MLMVCVDTDNLSDVTLGKTYDIIERPGYKKMFMNDNGLPYVYMGRMFITLEESRRNKIEEIVN